MFVERHVWWVAQVCGVRSVVRLPRVINLGIPGGATPTYLPSVDLAVEATDLAGLARGIAALIRRL